MSIEHKAITDANRHEPKGASTASANQVLKAAGDGSTYFGSVSYSELSGLPPAVGYKKSIYAESAATSQGPSATNTAYQLEFGVAQAVTDVSLSSAGALTFTNTGQYLINLAARFKKASSSGSAVLFLRTTLNGTQTGPSSCVVLTDLAQVIPLYRSIIVDATAGDVLKFEMIRDSSGMNDGVLGQSVTGVAGWSNAASASMTVYKYGG